MSFLLPSYFTAVLAEPGYTPGCRPSLAASKRMGGPAWFQRFWEPCAQCGNKQRIGSLGDGGKWVCMDKLPTQRGCVLSIGSSNDFSFESAALTELNVSCIHVYDHTSDPPPRPIPGLTFYKEAAAMQRVSSMRTRLSEPVSIVKIDCEGCETSMLPILIEAFPRAQFLIELHWEMYSAPQRTVLRLWKLFERHGFSTFSKEPNIEFSDGSCVELSLMHL